MRKLTKAQLLVELEELADYMVRASNRRNDESKDESLPAYSRGLAAGTSNGYALGADWIYDILRKV